MNLANIFKSLKQVTLNTMDIKFLKAKTDVLATKLNKDVHSTLANISGEIYDTKQDVANIKDVTDKIEFVGDKISPECLPAYVDSIKDVFLDVETGDFYNVETSIDPITQEVIYEQGSTQVEKVPGIIYHDVNEDKQYRVSELHNNIEITTSTQYYTKQEVDSIKQEVNSTKQDKLTSGSNIKTINGESVLGEGNLELSGVFTISSTDEQMIEIFNVNTNDSLDISNYNSPQEFLDFLNEYDYPVEIFNNLCQNILQNIDKTIIVMRAIRMGVVYIENKSIVISKYVANNPRRIVFTLFDEKKQNTITYTLQNVYQNIWLSYIDQKDTTPLVVNCISEYNSETDEYTYSVDKTTTQIYEAWNEGRLIYAKTIDDTILRLTMPPLEDIAVFSGIYIEDPNINMELRIWEEGNCDINWAPLQEKLYFDSEPTENSNENILTSGSIFTALNEKQDKILFGTVEKNIFTKGRLVKDNKSTVYQITSGQITPKEGTIYVDLKYGKLYTWFDGGVGFIQIAGIKS